MTATAVAIIGAGPYGLSLAAHLAARKIEHRIFGFPMSFWYQIADAGGERYLKSYCFGTNISSPKPGYSFADYSEPRGLETFEPCTMADFAAYGRWFPERRMCGLGGDEKRGSQAGPPIWERSRVSLDDGERFLACDVVVATGPFPISTYIPPILSSLPAHLVTHTSRIDRFADFRESRRRRP